MRKIILVILLLTCPAYGDEAGIFCISMPRETVKQYETFTADITLVMPNENPSVSETTVLDADITMPDGKTVTMPLFYSGQRDTWKMRYTPAMIGRYSYKLKLKTGSKTRYSGKQDFRVTPGASDGFLRKSKANPLYPVFDSGKPFFGVGHDIGWVTNNNIGGYEKYFTMFKENGCNLTRIWLNVPWTFRIETQRLGLYNMGDSAKLDALLELARRCNIYIILVLDTYGSLMEEHGTWNEQCWKTNPYNKLNGGPCEKPWDFFSNEEARRYYKNRLRYIIARWSYSPNIIAFELWNEMDAPADWTRDISNYIKSINPHGQFITTSLGYPWGNNFDESSIWRLDEIDMIDRHLYGNMTKDIIENLVSINKEMSKKYNKYMIVGEFGMDATKSDADIDPDGKAVALHNSLWAAALTRSFSTSLNWWWAEYVKAKNLYSHYRAVSNFVRGLKWNSPRVEFLKITPIKCARNNSSRSFSNITIPTADMWGDTSYREFYIGNNGDLSGGVVNAYLHSDMKQDIRVEPVFHVNYPTEGKFTVRVDMVSQGANLVIKIDGKEVLNKELPAGQGTGPWKRSLYWKNYDVYQCVYDTDITIDVPSGEHTIQLSNTGADWVRVKRITLLNYMSSDFANASVTGLLVDNTMLFWIYNKEFNWKNIKKDIRPSLIRGASFTVTDVQNGAYDVEWWDTFNGKIFLRRKAIASNNELKIMLPDLAEDLACKVTKQGE